MNRGMRDGRINFIEDWQPSLPSKDQTKTIWRYIDFTQFISLLEKESLWFSSIDQFIDPYEGTIPPKVEKEFAKLQGEDIKNIEHINQNNSSAILSGLGAYKYFTYANCWHINATESAGMWEMYREAGKEIAIKSNIEYIQDAIKFDDQEIKYGMVEYRDFDNIEEYPFKNGMGQSFYKRDSFDYENEFRAVFIDSDQMVSGELENSIQATMRKAKNGQYIGVDIETLIDSICISPTADSWLSDLVETISDTYDFDIKIEDSQIAQEPDSISNHILIDNDYKL